MRKRYKLLLLALVLLLFGVIFRTTLFGLAGNWLIYEDELEQADAIFLLGGGAYDRSAECARILEAGFADKVICTGGMIPGSFLIVKLRYKEAVISRLAMMNLHGVDGSKVDTISRATSTKEESEVIREYCLANNLNTVIIVSSLFHTRRVKSVFKSVLETAGINVIIRGAPSSTYNEAEWWNYERGMIMVNNEYMKHLYYFFKY